MLSGAEDIGWALPSIRPLRLRPPSSPPKRQRTPSMCCAKSLGFWSVATVGSSILTRSPINLRSTLPNSSLFFRRASIYSRPSFLRCPPVTRSLLVATHCVSPVVAENQLGWFRLSPVEGARKAASVGRAMTTAAQANIRTRWSSTQPKRLASPCRRHCSPAPHRAALLFKNGNGPPDIAGGLARFRDADTSSCSTSRSRSLTFATSAARMCS